MPQARRRHDALVQAAGFSLAVHAAVIGWFSVARPGGPDPSPARHAGLLSGPVQGDHAPEATAIDVEPAAAEPVAPAAPPLPPPSLSMVADTAVYAPRTSAPGVGVPLHLGAAAPDTGAAAGRALPAALRRDRSTLRARLSTGATSYQMSRERTARNASSPQAVRQEPVAGLGDSSRTRQAGRAATIEPPALPGGDEVQRAVSPPHAPMAFSAGADGAAARGPLDAEIGEKRFDVDVSGPARDRALARAASDEPRPGRLDLAAASAAGAGDPGRGPSTVPGAMDRAGPGVAPAPSGLPRADERSPSIEVQASERQHARALGEIRRRVFHALRWPARPALLLEQGEVVVRFEVRADGRVPGSIDVVKSAGIAEFDAEAVSVVRRASPFPPPGRPLLVTMPIAFDNPVVR